MQSNYKEKDIKDLHKELAESRKSLFDFRISVAGGKVKDVKEGRNIRKQIARIMTELSSRRNETN
ncbi:MAG: 50S ribosomal protein L29 [Candidatus Yonathbacteria bacterium RIFOXYC1_FULL_52_10]|uniref:Large ribosomal subunit protein uL29 n=1 Tax=Candidatus Yonathbacteria bacterium RIFOXYD1_FULL_52_36 TaxID=1802730 RepID=A0A1G2SIN9_9BACT|nr:MAG: 50S ribosomal protein L29 [Candidatus Yonathbacteria bacterium RIFOXYC1_FULL_52_10]OHA84876.1 MAG: 50S ribosomal protein L29 [Candidatus Yonathbacteria bacterium RIFOXYD1_FULL_52_36]